jgi:hypothetical protein
MNDRPRAPFQVVRAPDQTINHLVNRPAFSNFRTRLRHYLADRKRELLNERAAFNHTECGREQEQFDEYRAGLLAGRIEEIRYLIDQFEHQPNSIFTPHED